MQALMMLNTVGILRPGMQQQDLALGGGGLFDCDVCRRTPSLLLFEALIVRFYPQSAVSEEQTAKAPFKMKETRIKEGRFKLPQGARANGRLRPSARYVNLDPTRCRRVLDHVPPSCR